MQKNHFRSFALSLVAAVGLISFAYTNVPRNNQTVYAVSDKSLANLKFHKQEIVTVDTMSHAFLRVRYLRKMVHGKNTATWIT